MKENRIIINPKILLWALLFAGAVALFGALKEVIIIFFLAFIVSSGIRPVVDRLEKQGIPRLFSLLTVFSVVAFFIVGVLFLTIDTFIAQFNRVTDNLPEITRNVLESIQDVTPQEWGVLDDETIDNAVENINSANEVDAKTLGDVFDFFSHNFRSLGSASLNIISGITNFVFSAFIVIMVAAYLIVRREDVYAGVMDYIPKKHQKRARRIFDEVEKGLGEWVVGQLLLMFIIGVVSYIVLMIPYVIGFEDYGLYKFALLLAVLAGINEGFPNVGPTISIILASLLAIGTGESFAVIIYIIVTFTAIQQFEALFIVPYVMKKVVNIDPIIVILAIIAGFKLGSVLGAILSIPVVVIIKIILNEVNETRKKYEANEDDAKTKMPRSKKKFDEENLVERLRGAFRELF